MKNKFKAELVDRGEVADLSIYGFIGHSWWDDSSVSASQVQALLNSTKAKTLNVTINSEGGSVFDGIAIYNQLKRFEGKVKVTIDALAASAASVIAMAGDEIVMGLGSMIMIHNAWTYAEGGAAKLREIADQLDGINESLVDIYAEKTGLDKAELHKLMDAETWMDTDFAISKGFASSVEQRSVKTYNSGNSVYFAGLRVPADRVPERVRAGIPPALPEPEEKILNLKELQEKHPELYAQACAEGAAKERQRLAEIDELKADGYESLIAKAKADASYTAEKLAYQILIAQNRKGMEFLNARKEDAKPVNELKVEPLAEEKPLDLTAEAEKLFARISGGR